MEGEAVVEGGMQGTPDQVEAGSIVAGEGTTVGADTLA